MERSENVPMDKPRLNLIEESRGIDEALVLIKGYLSEKENRPEDNAYWMRSLREAGWHGSIYHLWWDASSFGAVVRRLLLVVSQVPVPFPHKLIRIPVRAGISITTLLLHWRKVKKRAKRVGRDYLPDILNLMPEKYIILMGVSLGVRVVYHGLINIQRRKSPALKHAILLGGTVARGETRGWERAVEPLEERIVNVYNQKDYVLRYLFKIAQIIPKSPCGLKPIKLNHPKIVNIDATDQVGRSLKNHWEHPDALPSTIGWLFQ